MNWKKTAAAVVVLLLLLAAWMLRGASPGGGPRTATPALPAEGGGPPPAVAKTPPHPVLEPQPAPASPAAAASGPKPAPEREGSPGVGGRVVNGDRSPAADLAVGVSLDGRLLGEVRTGPDGDYFFPRIQVDATGRRYFVFNYLVRDGKGRAARDCIRMGVRFDPGEEHALSLWGCDLQPLVLRDAPALSVRVLSGGSPVEGATVWAEEEAPCFPATGPVTSAADGTALIEDLPAGRWTVFARARGRGAGRASVDHAAGAGVEVTLVPRDLEIEAVGAATGAPLEGVRFSFWERRTLGSESQWRDPFPPPDPPPTDSAGRTRLSDLGEVALRLKPVPSGLEEPPEGTEAVEVDARSTFVRVPVQALRTVRWPVLPGERGVPPDGSAVTVGEERLLVDPHWQEFANHEDHWAGTIRQGALVVEGVGPGPFRALARAPDGSLARLEAAPGADRGEPVRFFAPRRLVVVVRDEDGKPVPDPVALLAPDGTAVAQPLVPEKEGRTVFEGLYAGEAVVCALARTEWGGAEVARVPLAEGDRTVEAVVGREFTVVLRFRAGGRPRIPGQYELTWLTPGPPVRGEPHSEFVDDPRENADGGEVRISVRPAAPGRPVVLRIALPGREPILREIPPPAVGAESATTIDL